ncbi:MAG: hypothetical protein SOZ66_05145 [Candidatus Cryptobacteroides sp.]|nr:hypothetical protein [Candidatus Cryptobacteroides sp.]
MRKSLISICLMFSGILAGAQTMYDAMTFSEVNYYGTARSMSLGNAMTALGGDLGSVGINPAGSAVNPYWQFTLTPGFSIASSNSRWSTLDNGIYDYRNNSSKTRFIFPNTGLTMNFETGNRHGLKRYTFGFVVNTTANHLAVDNIFATGNSNTSMAGCFASGAYGIDATEFDASNPYKGNIPWNTVLAQQSGMIATFGGKTDEYIGINETIDSENNIYIPGPLKQRSFTMSSGSKSDIIMNFGADINDKLYVGFNLGVPTLQYVYSETFSEAALDPADFPVTMGIISTNYDSSLYRYGYQAEMDGIYAKFGLIYVPVKGVRLGAAIKTPTLLTVRETWQLDATVNYTSLKSTQSSSPVGEWSYDLRTPWEANFGAAFTFADKGFVSLDYEMMDYSIMKFVEHTMDDSFYADDPYYQQNRINRLFCGVSHSLRLGAEYKIIPSVSVRAGFNLTTSPEKIYKDNLGLTVTASDYSNFFDDFESGRYRLGDWTYSDSRRSYALGLGYSSNGSFFADAAFRLNRFPASYRKPYADYIYDNDGVLDTASPVIRTDRTLCDLLFTFGWRF